VARPALEELCAEADRRAIRVLLHLEGGRREGREASLSRLELVDRDGLEVCSMRLGRRRSLEQAATALHRLIRRQSLR
jgi:hypothetical protein